jgi:hypothetical protein
MVSINIFAHVIENSSDGIYNHANSHKRSAMERHLARLSVVTRHGGSVAKTPLHDQPPIPAPGRHLLPSLAHAARQP